MRINDNFIEKASNFYNIFPDSMKKKYKFYCFLEYAYDNKILFTIINKHF